MFARLLIATTLVHLATPGYAQPEHGRGIRTSQVVRSPAQRIASSARLIRIAPDRFRTPNGLIVGQAARERIRQQIDNPPGLERPHGVFDGGEHGAIQTIDTAWRMIQQDSRFVTSTRGQDSAVVYTIDMRQRLGFVGGNVQTRPEARHLRLIVQDGELVNAYPIRDRAPRLRERSWTPLRFGRQPHPERPRALNEIGRELARRLQESAADHEQTARHVRLGFPSDPTLTTVTDRLIVEPGSDGYVMSFNAERRVPNWVSWEVSAEHIAQDFTQATRSGDFRRNESLPSEFPQADIEDYRRSGLTRGHMVASGERQRTRESNSMTFLMTNMVPQTESNNTGAWRHMEHYLRDLSRTGHTIHAIAGPGYDGPARAIGNNDVAVPDFTWKVAVIQAPGESIHPGSRVIAIIVPNETGVSKDASEYRVSPAEIERRTGLQFFTHLPQATADALRNRVDDVQLRSPGEVDRPSSAQTSQKGGASVVLRLPMKRIPRRNTFHREAAVNRAA